MTTLQLGGDVLPLTVKLADRTDFVCELTYKVGGVVSDWPVGTDLTLAFDAGQVWTATITGPLARFEVDEAVTALIGAGEGVMLHYLNGATSRALAIGQAVRHG